VKPFSLRLLLGVPCRKRNPIRQLPIETDLEGVLSGTGEWHVEHQHGPGLDIDHAGGRFAELHGTLTSQELIPTLVNEADPDSMDADLGAPPPDPKHQVGAGVHRREVGQPYVLEHAEHTELALLIDQGVVGNNGEIKVQFS
jgi:hypothetical protein